MREYQVRICEGLGVQFPGPTRRGAVANLASGTLTCDPFETFRGAVSRVLFVSGCFESCLSEAIHDFLSRRSMRTHGYL
jgi:hypothetical protein